MAEGEVEGTVKIVSDAKYGEILGVHIVGARATELVGEAVLAMQLEVTARSSRRASASTRATPRSWWTRQGRWGVESP